MQNTCDIIRNTMLEQERNKTEIKPVPKKPSKATAVALTPAAARALNQIVEIDGGTKMAAAGRAIESMRCRYILEAGNKAYAALRSSESAGNK